MPIITIWTAVHLLYFNHANFFFKKNVVANKQNSIVPIPSEWYGAEIEIIAFPVKIGKQNASDVQDDKQSALNSLLKFADSNRVFEKDFHFNRETCYDR